MGSSEALYELVCTEAWVHIKIFLERTAQALDAQLESPAEKFPDDYIKKEVLLAEKRALSRLIWHIESEADKFYRGLDK